MVLLGVGSKILLLIVVSMIAMMTSSAEIIVLRIFNLHCMGCRFWGGIVPSHNCDNVVMRNVSSVAWLKIIDDDIFVLEFNVVSSTCNSFILVWLANTPVTFADPALNSATTVVHNEALPIGQQLLSYRGGMIDWCTRGHWINGWLHVGWKV